MTSDADLKLGTGVYYQVNEQFVSIQGEGVLVGTPSTFIRLQGCPVGCSWCDSGPLADTDITRRTTNGETRNTWGRGGLRMPLMDIVGACQTRHVIITGGEPTIWNLKPLVDALHLANHQVQLETSGLKGVSGARFDHITWSPKQNLNYAAHPDIFKMCDEVKWVVDDQLDFDRVLGVLNTMRRERKTWMLPTFVLMPEGSPPKSENVERCMTMLRHVPMQAQTIFRFGDRLQYRLNMR